MKNTITNTVVLSITLLVQTAWAADSSAPSAKVAATSTVALFKELDELRSQNALLAEALKNAELKYKISQVGKPQAGNQTDPTVPQIPPAMPAAAPVAASRAAVTNFDAMSAQVQMVSGTGTNLVALITLANGSKVNARVGSTIPGLGTVRSISLNEVTVFNKKDTNSIPFASDTVGVPPVTNLQAAQPVSPMQPMPPFPPAMMMGKGR